MLLIVRSERNDMISNMSGYIVRNNSRSYPETSPSSSSSSHRKFPPNNQTIVLLSRSIELAGQLSEVINTVVHSVEDLPTQSDLKAVILDHEFSKLGR